MHIDVVRVNNNKCGLGTDTSAWLFRCGGSLHGEAEGESTSSDAATDVCPHIP